MPIIDLSPLAMTPFSEQVIEARRFYLGPFDDAAAPVVVAGGFERVSQAYVVSRRAVPFVAIELVVGGEGEAVLDGKAYPLRAGSMFIYGQHTPHRLTTSRQNPLTKYFIELDGKRSHRLMRPLQLQAGQAWQVQQWIDLARLFEEVVQHGTGRGRHRQAICDTLLRALLMHAAQSLLPQQQPTDAYRSYQHCSALIETAHPRIRSLDDLAIEAGLDAAYICRLFKKFDTKTPYQCLLHKRMTAAAARLYDGTVSVRQVAKELGYADQFHFSRSFKSVLGAPPSTFRRLSMRQLASDGA